MTPEVQDRIRLYLLGQLKDNAEELEQDLLTNEELFEELLVIEDEIIDGYLAGNLSSDERAAFEQNFLATPQRQENLRFARALKQYVTAHDRGQKSIPSPSMWNYLRSRPWLLPAAATIILVMIVGGFWSFRQKVPQTFATINLTIGNRNRGDSSPASRVKLPLNKDALKIVLSLPDASPASRYRVELVNENRETRPLEIVEQDAHSLSVVIPAGQLTPGQYALNLFVTDATNTETQIAGNYFFIVE